MMKNVFDKTDTAAIIQRIEALTPETQAQWGKMNVAQMLAHCNVTYEMIYTDKHPKPNAVVRFLLKLMVKNAVVSDKPYKKNGSTAPQFIIADERIFQDEQKRLIDHINQTQQLGGEHFDGKESHSFGPLSTEQWNNLFSKHLDHHLTQFGV